MDDFLVLKQYFFILSHHRHEWYKQVEAAVVLMSLDVNKALETGEIHARSSARDNTFAVLHFFACFHQLYLLSYGDKLKIT